MPPKAAGKGRPRPSALRKQAAGRCLFCGEPAAEVLDEHHIVAKSAGGHRTSPANLCVACANCHRKIHAGRIVCGRWHATTLGRPALAATVDGKEGWFVAFGLDGTRPGPFAN